MIYQMSLLNNRFQFVSVPKSLSFNCFNNFYLKFPFCVIKFQSGDWYSTQVRRNDTELLILRSNGDVMTVSQSLRNVDQAH